ncbi:hypothetical protein [Daejeonella sp.]|uniref:hypothetical protein n=1 Tax=Daejeonella sp. TaxID=2805397 RepID=UPI0030BBDC7B
MMNSVGTQNPLLYKLVAGHYFVSAICFACLSVMLLFAAQNLSGHYFHPQLLAVTHMAALGWGTLIIFGAVYQLLPVILETELYSHRAGWISLVLFVSGLIALVYSFWTFQPGIHMQCGSVLLLAGIVLFGVNVFLTAKKNRDDIHQEFIITACIWLIATALLGTLLVFNFRYTFLQRDHILFLKLHAHMGLAGWFLLLITGVSSKLIPMFLVSGNQKSQLLSRSYYLINAGLILFLIDTYFSELNMKTYAAAAIVVAGILCWLTFVLECFRSRMRKTIDLPIWHTLLSMVLLAAAIFILPLIVFDHLRSDPRAVSYTTIYGSLLFMGWISSLILGQTFKTLPFVVWIRHYQHLAGKGPIPMPADLYKTRWLKVQFVAFLLFTLIFYTGMFFRSAILINAGLGCFFIVALTYLFNVMVVLFHKTKSKVP